LNTANKNRVVRLEQKEVEYRDPSLCTEEELQRRIEWLGRKIEKLTETNDPSRFERYTGIELVREIENSIREVIGDDTLCIEEFSHEDIRHIGETGELPERNSQSASCEH
jgi:hypothetical protein